MLTRALSEAVPAGGPLGVVVDLSTVDYLSSAGLRVLESVAARLAGQRRELILCGLRDSVELAFLFAGSRPNIAIEPSVEIAVSRATSSKQTSQQS